MTKSACYLGLLLFFLSGCATSSYTVVIDSVADKGAFIESFILASGMTGVSDDNLKFKEYSRIATNALIQKGYTPAVDAKSADVIILLSYGISDPQRSTITRSIPIYTNQGTTSEVKNQWGQTIGSVVSKPSNPYAPFSYRAVSEELTEYSRYIMLTAYDSESVINAVSSKSSPKMVWEANISSTGSSSDLRKIFPVMIFASQAFFGEDSEGKRVISLDLEDEDPRIQELARADLSKKIRKPARTSKP